MSENSTGMYVIDSEYRIVTCNAIAKALYPKLIKGEKCHQCLMGLDAPCEKCPVKRQIQGPNTYFNPIRQCYETVNAVEMILEDDTLGHAVIFSSAWEKALVSRSLLSKEETFCTLYQQAYKDALTGGDNYQGFIYAAEEVLEKAEDKTDYAILFFDIKNFKAVNEVFGIENGDVVLKYFYNTLLQSDLKPLVVARAEADHFLYLTKKETLDLDHLASHLEKVWTYKERTLHIYLRCGILYIEDGEMSVSSMIDRARLAKQSIVDEHINSYAVFDNSMHNHYIDQAEILAEYEEAIARNEFQVYYQPVVEAATGKLVSAEALVRWFHPIRGAISPGMFIPALEKNGHIAKLDWYVIQKVYEDMTARMEAGLPIVPVSINLSWMDFYDEKLIENILERLKSSPFPADSVRYEVTETSFVALERNHTNLLEKFRKYSSKIILDDFGSGYSSFGMLKNYDFDVLKIDMCFTKEIEKSQKVRNILKAIIEMSHQMGIKVVTEGAETKEQVDFLRENGCDFIQGYYFAKPLPKEEFDAYVDQQTVSMLQ